MRRSWRSRMNGLHIWQKLLVLGGVFALLFAIPTSLYFSQVAAEFARTSREVAGLKRSEAALGMLRAMSQHRSLAAGYLAGDAGVAAPREQAAAKVDSILAALRNDSGTGLLGGIAIVILAIVIDRISQSFGARLQAYRTAGS